MGAGICALEPPPHDGADCGAVRDSGEVRPFVAELKGINCTTTTYAGRHYGQDILVTRKGAGGARAKRDGHHSGSMERVPILCAAREHGNFMSCSHGAGARCPARSKAAVHRGRPQAHESGVECRKDAEVIDETPAAYKSIEAVMAAQSDLVEVVTLCARWFVSRDRRKMKKERARSSASLIFPLGEPATLTEGEWPVVCWPVYIIRNPEKKVLKDQEK